MRKQIFLLIALIGSFSFISAQTSDSPWAVNISANLVSIQDDAIDSDTGFGVPTLSLSRYIMSGFSIGAQYSFCLLYTSPSPRDRQKCRMPSSA